MKADRLLSLLLLLQAKGRLSGRELARRLEVSLRTINRDVEALSAAGVPVLALRGARGGFKLDDEWRTRVPGLDASELRALLMAQPRVVGDSHLARAAERALDKLMAALPTSLREQASQVRKRLHVDTTGWSGTAEDLSLLPLVQEAVSRDRRLAIRYWPAGKDARERVVDPLDLVAKGGTWYLVAGTPEGLRTYRVSRIENARLLDAGFERPSDFDLAAYWKSSTDELRKSRGRYEATLRIAPDRASQFQRWRSASATPPSDEPEATGWVTLKVPFDDEDQAAFIATGMGASVDVIAPSSLRERVAERHRAALERAALRP